MAIKLYKPTTPANRGKTTQDFNEITTKKPHRPLLINLKKSVGRNNQGKITTRHKGGGVRKFYRVVNFRPYDKLKAKILSIEYDPYRSARIALIKDDKNNHHYILAAKGFKVGQVITVGKDSAISVGNRLALKDIPFGSAMHAVEIEIGSGAKLARSAGNSAQLMGIDNGYAQVKLPSGEIRLINENCMASIGTVGNDQHQNIKIGKAGRNRHKGIRPSVRGVVMNAVDHPHGGGDGGAHHIGGGSNHGTSPRTPWGQKTIGYKTRRRKSTTKYILRSRHQSKRR